MVKRKQKTEADSTYFLKLVMYIIVGSIWVKITKDGTTQFPIPVGLIVGLLFASHEHFKADRKIEYAILLIAMFVGFWAPIGLYISL